MSESEKAKILGYVEQTPEQITQINEFKNIEIQLVDVVNHFFAQGAPVIDKRWMSIAKTHFQEGFMAAIRAIARPSGD